jgi:general secretion pathway protein L
MAGLTITVFPLRFWRWWLHELQSLAPLADQRKLANRRTCREIVINGDHVSLHEKQRLLAPLHEPALIISGISLAEFIAQTKRMGQVILSLGSDEYFVRSSVLPVQALPRAQQILDLELRHVLPLEPSAIFTGWYQAGPQQNRLVTLVQVALKRARAEELLGALSAAGVKTAAISFRDSAGMALPLVMDAKGKTLGASTNVMWQKVSTTLLAAALAMLAAFVWFAFNQQNTKIAAIEFANDQMREKAIQVRKSIEQVQKEDVRVAKLNQLRGTAPNLVAVWANLAHILPDTAWISTFALNGKTVSLDGEAADAEGLLNVIEASRFYRNVRFTAPVTKNPGADRSHYSIAMEFEDLP